MNAVVPWIALLFGVLTFLFHAIGLDFLLFLPLSLCGAAAVAGLIFGVKENPVSSRIACALALLIALTPLLIPEVQRLRLASLARKRAIETAPAYKGIDAAAAALKPQVQAYFKANGLIPDMDGDQFLPAVDLKGERVDPPTTPALASPKDPFRADGGPMRWVAVRGEGVLLVSVGQDGQPEMPLPRILMDPAPAHPLAGFAMVGADPRLYTYDPTNGALGLGDVVRFQGRGTYEEAFRELFDAFDIAEAASPTQPPRERRKGVPDPLAQSHLDGLAAEKLLASNPLAAVALASRGKITRTPYDAEWTEAEFSLERTAGLGLYQLACYREAADQLIDYLAGRPNDVSAQYYLAACLYAAGQREPALLHLAAASQISTNSADTLRDRAEASFRSLSSGQPVTFPEPWLLKRKREAKATEKKAPAGGAAPAGS